MKRRFRLRATQRYCRKCGDPIGIDDDTCQTCGESNPVVLPWYLPLIGAAILALIAYLLIDFDALRSFIENFGQPR